MKQRDVVMPATDSHIGVARGVTGQVRGRQFLFLACDLLHHSSRLEAGQRRLTDWDLIFAYNRTATLKSSIGTFSVFNAARNGRSRLR